MRFMIATATAMTLISQAYALNIVVTNDDSYETKNVQQLKLALEADGHHVLLAVPCAHQSGKGGSMGSYLTPVPVHTLSVDDEGTLNVDDNISEAAGYCVGDLEADKATKLYKDFVDATPLQASLFGISKAEEIWGNKPDLIISGPNEGRNVGFAVFLSGTLGAAHVAIVNNIPAIAVSAGSTPSDDVEALNYAKLIAAKTVEIVDTLEATARKCDVSLMPNKMGLNVNLPDAGELNSETPFKFTQVNWASGMTLEFGNLGAAGGYGSYYGYTEDMELYGLNFMIGEDMSGDTNPNSEGNAVLDGYVTISPIDATENAPTWLDSYTQTRLYQLK